MIKANSGVYLLLSPITIKIADLASAVILLQISEVCQCDVRTFSFSDLPAHLTLGGNSWKPIIVQV